MLGSSTHLVEIDLLRTGEKMPAIGKVPPSDYRILVSRGDRRPNAMVYAFTLRETIPAFPLPLRPQDPEPLIDLQTLLNQLYDLAGYDLAIDYGRSSVPSLSKADAAWADVLLREQGLR